MNEVLITQLNDFIFCPASIYFHSLYGNMDNLMHQSTYQINGTASHRSIDENTYSTRNEIITSMSVYSEQYNLIGKIDMYDVKKGILTERKRTINKIYDGYVFQVYGQCLALREMGYEVNKIVIHSMTDNKNYLIPLPEQDEEMFSRFENVIYNIMHFNLEEFVQSNKEKCHKCIYAPACDRGE